MGMNVGSSSGSEPDLMMDINTTPLIDVMLVLLIMLIITIPIQTHAVKLNMPVATPPTHAEPPVVVNIEVDFDGTILWDAQVVQGKPDLENRMRTAAAQPTQPEIHLRPNKLVKYQHVAMVMASAQRIGLMKVGVVGNEQCVN